ncbi:MAG: hypothetical protein M3280_04900 [Actinomycetota bacterium]|nr:hypothetical protein [Actinomycetota bacterium]
MSRASDREYRGTVTDPRIESVAILRPQKIPTHADDGFFDVGVGGEDWIQETGADVERVTSLAHSNRRIDRCGSSSPYRDSGIASGKEVPAGARVSTEFPNLTKAYFEKLGIPI